MLNVKVLEDFYRDCTVLLRSRLFLQDLFKGVNDEPNHELVFVGYVVSVFLVLFPEQPPVGPLAN